MNVVVTGAGSGIGAATARELKRRGYGVAVTDVNSEAARKVATELGSFHARLDVTDRESIQSVIRDVDKTLGPIDAWISNAGVSTMVPFLEISEDDWQHMLAVNLSGVFHCGQEIARHFVATGRRGVIVNLASMAAKRGGIPYLAHYVASKFGVVGLTQAMAYELAPHGIRVNSVCPGYVATSMQERELVWEAKLRGIPPEEVRDLYIRDTPLGRIEAAEDVAKAVAFLAGPDADFVTGEALSVNGGAFMD
jgi:meso-butanediol dehydrogenase / (S,S)-butanediol dehydrogenase / diacetyl reductase